MYPQHSSTERPLILRLADPAQTTNSFTMPVSKGRAHDDCAEMAQFNTPYVYSTISPSRPSTERKHHNSPLPSWVIGLLPRISGREEPMRRKLSRDERDRAAPRRTGNEPPVTLIEPAQGRSTVRFGAQDRRKLNALRCCHKIGTGETLIVFNIDKCDRPDF